MDNDERMYTETQMFSAIKEACRYRDALDLIQQVCDEWHGRITRDQIIELLNEDEKSDLIPEAWVDVQPSSGMRISAGGHTFDGL